MITKQVRKAFEELMNSLAEAEEADAGFDGGEFSGPAHGLGRARAVKKFVRQHRLTEDEQGHLEMGVYTDEEVVEVFAEIWAEEEGAEDLVPDLKNIVRAVFQKNPHALACAKYANAQESEWVYCMHAQWRGETEVSWLVMLAELFISAPECGLEEEDGAFYGKPPTEGLLAVRQAVREIAWEIY